MKSIFTYSVSLLIALVILSSCSSNLSTESIETRLLGTWLVDEVKYSKNGRVGYKDVTANFDNYKFTFIADGSLIFVDMDADIDYDGYWYILEDWIWDEDEQQDKLTQTLILNVWDNNTEATRVFRFKEIQISQSKMKVRENRNDGKYKWKLIK